MKSIIRVLILVISFSTAPTFADQYNECGSGYSEIAEKVTIWYEFSWDYWEVIVYDMGFFYVTGTGPVEIPPLILAGFPSASYTNQGSSIYAYLNETYQTPAVWTITGLASLYHDYGGEFTYPYPGIVGDSCAGGF